MQRTVVCEAEREDGDRPDKIRDTENGHRPDVGEKEKKQHGESALARNSEVSGVVPGLAGSETGRYKPRNLGLFGTG